MKLLIAMFLVLFGCSKGTVPSEQSGPSGKAFSIPAADGKKTYVELYPAPQMSKAPLLILFHQAGSNLGEYRPLVAEWTKNGFNCLSVSQRSGGIMWNEANETQAQFDRDPGYLAAYLDMQAAMDWALKQGYPKIGLVGSSYSASLVFHLAEENTEVSAVAAFSPGEYGEMKGSVGGWVSKVRCPIFVACAESEYDDVMALYKQTHTSAEVSKLNRFVMFSPGAHGASAMRDDKGGASAAQYRKEFLNFIQRWKQNWK